METGELHIVIVIVGKKISPKDLFALLAKCKHLDDSIHNYGQKHSTIYESRDDLSF